MEKKRLGLIFIGLCLALVFSLSSVEAQPDACVDGDGDGWFKNTGKCRREEPPMPLDCDDGNPLVVGPPPCDDPDDPTPPPDPPPGIPIIAVVANKFPSGGAAGHITSQLLGGIYTNVRVKNFNKWEPAELRAKFDVLHIQWSSPSSMQVSWRKLRDFMLLGGGILFEDPQNVLEIVELDVVGVEHHVPGDDPAVVEFELSPNDSNFTGMYDEPEEILSAFVDQGFMNTSGYFADGSESLCLNYNPFSETIQTLGLGYGCLANNHMTFNASQTGPVDALTPFFRLEGSSGEAVGLYGQFGPGRILFTGPDSAVHASFVASPFQANHFCLLTNELIWVSQLPVTAGSDAKAAMDDCVAKAKTYRQEQGQLD